MRHSLPLLRFPARSVSETTESHSAPATVLSTILAAAFLLVSCKAQPVEEAENLVLKVTVETEVLQPQDFRSMLSVIGTFKSEFDARISAEVARTLTSFSADKDDMVRKEDVVAVLDDAKLRQEVLRLEAAVSQAQDAFERQKTQFDNNIGSASERDNAKYLYDQQAAALASLKIDLENTRIRAPFSGRIEATYA